MEKHIYFVRHGETDSNADGILRGPEAALTERGEEQARVVAERVRRIGVTALVSSSYKRTVATAKEISSATGIEIEASDLFVEWKQPTVIIGRHKDEPDIQNIHTEIHARRANPHYQHSDEETFDQIKTRATAALHLLASHSAERICVVTHGIFLRVLFGVMLKGERFDGVDFQDAMEHLFTSNTGITYSRYGENVGFRGSSTASGWEVISWNDSSHLG